IRAHQPFTRVASSPLTGLQRPGGAEDCCHGWSDAEGGAQPVEGPQVHCPPRRGGGSAERATRGGGARRAGRLLRPSGAASIARNLPRVALAALAPPVATILRPSG